MTFTRTIDQKCNDQIWVAISSSMVVVETWAAGRGSRTLDPLSMTTAAPRYTIVLPLAEQCTTLSQLRGCTTGAPRPNNPACYMHECLSQAHTATCFTIVLTTGARA